MPRYPLPVTTYTIDDVIRLTRTIQQVKRNMARYRTFGQIDWKKYNLNREYMNRLVVQLATAVLAVMT